LFLPLGASYNKSEHTWTFRQGSTIEFAHLEDETAIYQHAISVKFVLPLSRKKRQHRADLLRLNLKTC